MNLVVASIALIDMADWFLKDLPPRMKSRRVLRPAQASDVPSLDQGECTGNTSFDQPANLSMRVTTLLMSTTTAWRQWAVHISQLPAVAARRMHAFAFHLGILSTKRANR